MEPGEDGREPDRVPTFVPDLHDHGAAAAAGDELAADTLPVDCCDCGASPSFVYACETAGTLTICVHVARCRERGVVGG